MMKQNRRTGGLTAALAFFCAAALLFLLWRQLSPVSFAGEKQIAISVTYEDGSGEHFSLTTGAGNLRQAAGTVLTLEGEETPHGFTVYAVNGVRADYREGKAYWAIYVNGEYGSYSVDRQPVADGDAFAFVYELL